MDLSRCPTVAGGEAEAQRDPFKVQRQAGEGRLPRGTGWAHWRVPVPQRAEVGCNQGPRQMATATPEVCQERSWRS